MMDTILNLISDWIFDVGIAAIFIVITIIISIIMKLKISRGLFIGLLRALAQLIAVGYLIHAIFQLESVIYQLGLIFAMTVIASYNAHRQIRGIKGVFWITWLSIAVGVSFTLGVLLATGVIDTSPRYLIPFGGILVGNSMISIILVLERLLSSIQDRKNVVESALSLGAGPRKAIHHLTVRSIRAALIPRINTLRIVGIIQLPGAFIGMLLGGADPLDAAKLQLIVVYMLIGSVSISLIVTILLLPAVLFNRNEQLVLGEEREILRL
jgi:putative ABC transport system permease protein